MKFFLALVLCLCALPVAAAHAKEPITIAAFGDSLIAGYGLAAADAFPAQLERKLRADGHDVTILNDGVSGDTSAGGLARVSYALAQKPAVVILVLGGNDLLQGLPPATMQENLAAIIEKFQRAKARILLAGLKAPPSLGAKYVSAYDAVFPALAKRYQTAYYPVYLQGVYSDQRLMQTDGIHPNKDGVAVIVKAIYPSVTSLLIGSHR